MYLIVLKVKNHNIFVLDNILGLVKARSEIVVPSTSKEENPEPSWQSESSSSKSIENMQQIIEEEHGEVLSLRLKIKEYQKIYKREKNRALHYKKLYRNAKHKIQHLENTSSFSSENLLCKVFNQDQILALKKKQVRKSN